MSVVKTLIIYMRYAIIQVGKRKGILSKVPSNSFLVPNLTRKEVRKWTRSGWAR
jgi:hypothetical protein